MDTHSKIDLGGTLPTLSSDVARLMERELQA